MLSIEKMKSILEDISIQKQKKLKRKRKIYDKTYYTKNRDKILRKQNERYRIKCGLVEV